MERIDQGQGLYSLTIFKNIFFLYVQRYCKSERKKKPQLETLWFSKSEVVLLSNTSKYRKILITRLTTFLRKNFWVNTDPGTIFINRF